MAYQKGTIPQSVLIADDDPFIHTVLREMLGVLGIEQVHTASDGFDALRILDSLATAPDLLICDVFMPSMDGVEFLNQLGSRGFKGGILMVSGVDATMLDLSRVIGTGNGLQILEAFVKPLKLHQLEQALGLSSAGEPPSSTPS